MSFEGTRDETKLKEHFFFFLMKLRKNFTWDILGDMTGFSGAWLSIVCNLIVKGTYIHLKGENYFHLLTGELLLEKTHYFGTEDEIAQPRLPLYLHLYHQIQQSQISKEYLLQV